jgi:cytochrome c-type biogenesis protein CcmH/NrfG
MKAHSPILQTSESCSPQRQLGKLIVALLYTAFFVITVPQSLRAQASTESTEKFRQASEAMRQGNLEQAGEGFAEIVKRSPTFAEAYLNLGLVREEQGRHEEAIASFKRALLLKPRLRGANLFLGIAQYRSNQLDAAVVSLRNETAAYPKDATPWMWLGVVELEMGDGDNAVEALDRAVKLAPTDVDILYHRGQAHLFVSKDSYARMFRGKSLRKPMQTRNATRMRSLNTRRPFSLLPTSPAFTKNWERNTGVSAKCRKPRRRSAKSLKSIRTTSLPNTS